MWKSLRQQESEEKQFFRISAKEKLILCAKSMTVITLVNYCFYQSLIAFVPLSVLGWAYFKRERQELFHQKKEEARQQFKEMLLLTVAGQKAGYSVENALINSYADMENLYGDQSSICLMLWEIQTGLKNNLPVENLWKDIGEASGIAEIKEFSEVFGIAKSSSGNMADIMEKTAEVIGDRAETQKEIETLLSERKLEQKIMNIMPFFLMIYINFTSPGYFESFYHSMEGTAVMTLCLLFYLAACLLGIRIISIEV